MAGVKEPMLMFPLAIMIVMALLGIFVGGLSGGNVSTQGYNTNLGSAGHYTNNELANGVTNGMEPLGGGIINTTTGQPDVSSDAVPAANYQLNNFLIIATALSAAILGVIAVASVAGISILGSGVNAGVSEILFSYGGMAAIWLVLTAASASIFFGDTPLGLGSVFYAVLTIAFLIGSVTHVRGSGA